MELFLDEETSLYKRGEEGILPDGLAERFGYEAHRFEHALIGYPRAE